MNKYEHKIAEELLRKYYRRKSIYKNTSVNRRIDVSVDKILKDYADYNVNLAEKEAVNQAIQSLENQGFIQAFKLKYSEDYEKIVLCLDNIDCLEEYADKELGIRPRTYAVEQLQKVLQKYKHQGPLVSYYVSELENVMQNRSISLDSAKEEDLLSVLSFLEHNEQFLYIREASLLIFGDSKYLENQRRSQVNTILYHYFTLNGEEVFEDENLFERFNVFDMDQEICIKGPIQIQFQNHSINIEGLSGGVCFSFKDIEKIENIQINCEQIMTIENKTTFLRMNNENCYVYLGGFATKAQISFMKKLIALNPKKQYLHFGDIDAGGFWIHKKLCEQTRYHFKRFHMNTEDLENPCFKKYLKPLSDHDRNRLMRLKEEKEYAEVIEAMLERNIKLEQEIISYFMITYDLHLDINQAKYE